MQMSLNDPVAHNPVRPPTLGEVKKSLRVRENGVHGT